MPRFEKFRRLAENIFSVEQQIPPLIRRIFCQNQRNEMIVEPQHDRGKNSIGNILIRPVGEDQPQ